MKRCLILTTIFHYFLISSVAAQTTSQDFYRGKVLRVVVGNSVGGAMDDWARFIALYLGKHIPGNPDILVQNMPGAASIIAANHVYNVGKPDGLTLGLINPAIYIDQLLGAKEVKYDWSKFVWIGSPEKIDQVLYIRTDSPYKTLEDIRKAAEPPRCASLGRTGLGYYLPKLLEEGLGLKITIVAGYGGGGEMNLAIEKGEVHCRAGTASAYVSREPTRSWIKSGFIRALAQSGTTRYAKLADVPTIHELLETHKTPCAGRVQRLGSSRGVVRGSGNPCFHKIAERRCCWRALQERWQRSLPPTRIVPTNAGVDVRCRCACSRARQRISLDARPVRRIS